MRIVKNEGVFRLYDRQSTLILTDEKQLQRIVDQRRPVLHIFPLCIVGGGVIPEAGGGHAPQAEHQRHRTAGGNAAGLA